MQQRDEEGKIVITQCRKELKSVSWIWNIIIKVKEGIMSRRKVGDLTCGEKEAMWANERNEKNNYIDCFYENYAKIYTQLKIWQFIINEIEKKLKQNFFSPSRNCSITSHTCTSCECCERNIWVTNKDTGEATAAARLPHPSNVPLPMRPPYRLNKFTAFPPARPCHLSRVQTPSMTSHHHPLATN